MSIINHVNEKPGWSYQDWSLIINITWLIMNYSWWQLMIHCIHTTIWSWTIINYILHQLSWANNTLAVGSIINPLPGWSLIIPSNQWTTQVYPGWWSLMGHGDGSPRGDGSWEPPAGRPSWGVDPPLRLRPGDPDGGWVGWAGNDNYLSRW